MQRAALSQNLLKSGGSAICTSLPSTRTGQQATVMFGLPSRSPVRTLNCHPCHGQVTISPASWPSPIGPPACGQVLSTAKNEPATLNNAIQTPFTSTVFPVPGLMSSVVATVTNSVMSVIHGESHAAHRSRRMALRLILPQAYGIEILNRTQTE